jgi:rhodanese-related sulfurtransferase
MKDRKNIFKNIDLLNQKIDSLSEEVVSLRQQIKKKDDLFKTYFSRLASNETINIDSIDFDMGYLDLSPSEAFKEYSKDDYNFVLLDVSEKNFVAISSIEETLKIELEFLEMRVNEISSKSTPIYVISEDGTRSILACELLYNLGFKNINNISGGHKFWPGHKQLKIAA